MGSNEFITTYPPPKLGDHDVRVDESDGGPLQLTVLARFEVEGTAVRGSLQLVLMDPCPTCSAGPVGPCPVACQCDSDGAGAEGPVAREPPRSL